MLRSCSALCPSTRNTVLPSSSFVLTVIALQSRVVKQKVLEPSSIRLAAGAPWTHFQIGKIENKFYICARTAASDCHFARRGKEFFLWAMLRAMLLSNVVTHAGSSLPPLLTLPNAPSRLNLSRVRIFGSVMWAHYTKEKRASLRYDKADPHAVETIFVGEAWSAPMWKAVTTATPHLLVETGLATFNEAAILRNAPRSADVAPFLLPPGVLPPDALQMCGDDEVSVLNQPPVAAADASTPSAVSGGVRVPFTKRAPQWKVGDNVLVPAGLWRGRYKCSDFGGIGWLGHVDASSSADPSLHTISFPAALDADGKPWEPVQLYDAYLKPVPPTPSRPTTRSTSLALLTDKLDDRAARVLALACFPPAVPMSDAPTSDASTFDMLAKLDMHELSTACLPDLASDISASHIYAARPLEVQTCKIKGVWRDVQIPRTDQQARDMPEAPFWLAAMEKRVAKWDADNVLLLVPISDVDTNKHKPVRLNWVFSL